MNFHVMTSFPEMIKQGVHTSVTGKALDKGTIHLNAVNIRDFSTDKHHHVDDYPYGGGAGMVMQPQPVYDCYKSIMDGIHSEKKPRVVYMTPQGKVFSQAIAEELSKEEDLIFLCGHYEGIDERVLEEIVTDNLSIGDYVLTGGELAAMVMIDAIARLVPDVLNNEESAQYESFQDGLLEYPQYTRPPEFHGRKVPEVLLTGNHTKIESWRREKSLERTLLRRPELLQDVELSAEDMRRLAYIRQRQYMQADAEAMVTVNFDSERVTIDTLLEWIENQDDNRRFKCIELGNCLNHMYPKQAKKLLKWIVRHVSSDSLIKADIWLQPEDDVSAIEDMIELDKYTYTDGQLIWYMHTEDIWDKILRQWFKIVNKDNVTTDEGVCGHYQLRVRE